MHRNALQPPAHAPATRDVPLSSYVVAPLVVLIAALVVLRAAGALGLAPLTDWTTDLRLALASMFAFTGVTHFGPQQATYVRMVPTWMPRPREVVLASGVLELLGAFGLLLPLTASWAAICLALLLVAMFPANVKAARENIGIGGKPATPLWFRALVQVLFVVALAWAAL